MTVQVLPPAAVTRSGAVAQDVTTHGYYYRPLSPMLLGPVMLYDGLWSRTVENAWQFSKFYPVHAGGGYWEWALAGWANPQAVRYPMGKGTRPLSTLWAGQHLDYITARRRVYIPLYVQAVRFYQRTLLDALAGLAAGPGGLIIQDFDAYDHYALGYTWEDVINDPDRKMGHGFVLAMMIEGVF
jgi:hypothetical protein